MILNLLWSIYDELIVNEILSLSANSDTTGEKVRPAPGRYALDGLYTFYHIFYGWDILQEMVRRTSKGSLPDNMVAKLIDDFAADLDTCYDSSPKMPLLLWETNVLSKFSESSKSSKFPIDEIQAQLERFTDSVTQVVCNRETRLPNAA